MEHFLTREIFSLSCALIEFNSHHTLLLTGELPQSPAPPLSAGQRIAARSFSTTQCCEFSKNSPWACRRVKTTDWNKDRGSFFL